MDYKQYIALFTPPREFLYLYFSKLPAQLPSFFFNAFSTYEPECAEIELCIDGKVQRLPMIHSVRCIDALQCAAVAFIAGYMAAEKKLAKEEPTTTESKPDRTNVIVDDPNDYCVSQQ